MAFKFPHLPKPALPKLKQAERSVAASGLMALLLFLLLPFFPKLTSLYLLPEWVAVLQTAFSSPFGLTEENLLRLREAGWMDGWVAWKFSHNPNKFFPMKDRKDLMTDH